MPWIVTLLSFLLGGVISLLFLGQPALAAFWPLPKDAVSCAPYLRPYLTQMMAIHQQGTKWYFNKRRLTDYVQFLGPAWAQQIAQLTADEVWIDSGAGSGNALIDYLAKFSGQVVGISAALENWDRYWIQQAMQRFGGRFDFYIGLLETPLQRWPQIPQGQILTDLYGPMAYTHAPDVLLAHYAALLRPGGKAWIFIPEQNITLDQNGQDTYPRASRRQLTWQAYLALGQGLKWIDESLVFDQHHPHQVVGRILQVKRTDDFPYLAPLQAQVNEFKFNIPPQRSFVVQENNGAK